MSPARIACVIALLLASCGGGRGGGGSLIGGTDPDPLSPAGGPTYVGGVPTFTASGYIDDDGHLDLVVANPIFSRVDVLLGDGQGGFSRMAPVEILAGVDMVYLGHFNLDPLLDLFIVDIDHNEVHVMFGDGLGSFRPSIVNPTNIGAPIERAVVGRFDDDLLSDVAIATSQYVQVLLADGAGGWVSTLYLVGDSSLRIAADDIDFDDDLDLVVTDVNNSSVRALLGDGMGGFTPTAPVAVPEPTSLAVRGGWTVVGTSTPGAEALNVFEFLGGTFQPLGASPVPLDEFAVDLHLVWRSFLAQPLVVTNETLARTGLLELFEISSPAITLKAAHVLPDRAFAFGSVGDFVEGSLGEELAFPEPFTGTVQVVRVD